MASLKEFYSDRYLHIRSFSLQFLCFAGICAVLCWAYPPRFEFHFAAWQWLLVPLGLYAGGVSAVFIHNASHGSFSNRWLNAFCGHLAGVHQLWGFLGWKLIHMLHHQYSDNPNMDTHPPKGLSFWQFTKTMFLHSALKVTERYREHWGTGLRTRLLHRGVFFAFTGMALCHLFFWYLVLGPEGFVFFYLPSLIGNHVLFAHINYYCHPANPVTGDTAPANLNHNGYYKLANALWSGIYFHENHHRKPMLFNPRRMPAPLERKNAMRQAEAPILGADIKRAS